MPKLASSELTEDLHKRLGGQFLHDHATKVIVVHTVDANGWPHPAILSYFEVVAKDRHNIRMATYSTSNTTENLRQRGKVTLSIFDERAVYYIKGIATELRRAMRSAPHNSKLNVKVEQVLIDEADPVLEPGAYIASGITCVNPRIEADRERMNAVIEELLE